MKDQTSKKPLQVAAVCLIVLAVLAACVLCAVHFMGGRDDPATPVLAANTPTPAPAPAPTPEPTPAPTPEQTPAATPDPTAEPSPEPTEEPAPDPTEEPSPEPTAEPSEEPTEEPSPEPTAAPTAEPGPELTPDPTAEPSPDPTAEPAPETPSLWETRDFTKAGLGENSIVDPYRTYTYDQMVTDIGLLAETYPELISVYSIGQSVEGRDLIAFDFGTGDREVVLCSSTHACEHIATNALMYIVDQYCQGYEAGSGYNGIAYRDILDQVVFHIVPMLNPDGVNLAQNGISAAKDPDAVAALGYGYDYDYSGWKSNINGVDLNRNFSHGWGERDGVYRASAANWCGPAPLSEPESRAMQDLLDATDYHMLVSLHIRGEVVYWIDTETMELWNDHYPIAKRLANAFGYSLLGAEDVSKGGGYMVNTARYETQKFGCTLELCAYIHQDPYPIDRFPQVVDNVYSMLLVVGEEVLKMPEHTGHMPVREPEPAPEPTEEPTPAPTEEPTPTEEPAPTEEPTPTEEPAPTEAPTPTEAPQPTEGPAEPEIPEETAQPDRPPDAELPVQPTPKTETEDIEEPEEDAAA